MRAGTLRHKIVIQKPTATRDDYGDVLYSWSTSVELRARMAITGGREYIAAQSRYAELSALFVTRYSPDVGPQMRLYHDGLFYEILAAYDPTGIKRELQIVCRLLDRSGNMTVTIGGETVTIGGEVVTLGG